MTAQALGIAPGQLIGGQYRVEGLIGEGGYGAVYAATQQHQGLTQGRRVALKVLHPDVLIRQTALARFSREAQLAQSLHHPNTVRLFDFGQTEAGLPFIVYEYLDGKSLERVLVEQVRISARRTARVATQTLKALMEAHGIGIVHRDIKPANLFLCEYAGESDYVKVLDFGIAASQSTDDAGPLTREGASIGTPAYMAPEQVLSEPIDGRADLYALGLVMAEALSGTPVYSGRSGMQVAMQQVADAPVPLPREVAMSPLSDVIARATQKRREARFSSAADMLEAVERAAMGMQMNLSGPTASPATHVVLQTPGSPRDGSIAAIQEAPTTGMPIPDVPTHTPSTERSGPPAGLSNQPPGWTPGGHFGSHTPSPLSPAASTARSAGYATPGSDPRISVGSATYPSGSSPTMAVQQAGPAADVYAPTALGSFETPREAWPQHQGPQHQGSGPSARGAAPVGYPMAGPAAGASGPPPGEQRGATLSASFLPARTQPKSSFGSNKGAIIALVVGGILLASSAAAVGVYVWLGPDGRSRDSKGSAQKRNRSSDDPPKPKPVAPDSLDEFSIKGVAAQSMLDRMVEEGWEYQTTSQSDLGFGKQVIFIFEKNDITAQLAFTRKTDMNMEFGVGYAVHDHDRTAMLTIIEDSDAQKPLMLRLLERS